MKISNIQNHDDLIREIAILKDKIIDDEIKALDSFSILMKSLNPIALAKESLNSLFKDKDLVQNVKNIGLKTGANFLIDKVLGKNRSVKGFILSTIVENISEYMLGKNLKQVNNSNTK